MSDLQLTPSACPTPPLLPVCSCTRQQCTRQCPRRTQETSACAAYVCEVCGKPLRCRWWPCGAMWSCPTWRAGGWRTWRSRAASCASCRPPRRRRLRSPRCTSCSRRAPAARGGRQYGSRGLQGRYKLTQSRLELGAAAGCALLRRAAAHADSACAFTRCSAQALLALCSRLTP